MSTQALANQGKSLEVWDKVEAEKMVRCLFVSLATKMVLAQEIGSDPLVRKAIRRDWESRAVVNVKPTEKGFTVIDDLHPMHVSSYATLQVKLCSKHL